MRGWAMRVKAPTHGDHVEVGISLPLKHIRIRVRTVTGATSVVFGIAEARQFRRFLSRAIFELVKLYPPGLEPKV